MSSRNRRKEERKKQDLREGGFYEDIALIKALYDIINEAFQYGPQVRDLVVIALNINNKIPLDFKLMHNSLLKLQKNMRDSLKEIWPPHLNDAKLCDDPDAVIMHENINSLDVKYRVPPTNINTSWKLSLLSPN